MKYKKVLCGMLAVVMAAGSFAGGISVNAAETVEYSEIVEINAAESDFEFDSATKTITKYVGTEQNVVIPSSIGGVAVKTIGTDSFASNETITSVEIPQGVTSIEEEAFLNCPNLKTVVIPKGVESLGQLAFFMCEKLEKVTMGSGIAAIELNTFYGCSSLKSIELPDGVTKIDSHAFMGCTGLAQISIPSSVTNMEEEIFNKDTEATIICEEGSKAYEYACANGMKKNVKENTEAQPTQTPEQKKETYKITYVLNRGKISGTRVEAYDGTVNVKLPQAVREKYLFKGWYAESSFKTKVTAIKKGTTGNKIFYAKWEKVKAPSKPTISKVQNKNAKKMTVKLKKEVSGVAGYEMVYATDKKFKKNKKTVRFTGTSKTVGKLKKGKTYYVKVRAYKLDSTNSRIYGNYSSVKKVTIKK